MENKKITQGSLAATPRIEEVKEPAAFTEQDAKALRELKAKKQAAQRAEANQMMKKWLAKLQDTKVKLSIVAYVAITMGLFLVLALVRHNNDSVVLQPTPSYISFIKGCMIAAPILFLVSFTVSGGYRLWKELTKTMIFVVILLLLLAASQKALEYLPSSEAANALELMANPSRIWAMIMDFYKSVIVPWVTGA